MQKLFVIILVKLVFANLYEKKKDVKEIVGLMLFEIDKVLKVYISQ